MLPRANAVTIVGTLSTMHICSAQRHGEGPKSTRNRRARREALRAPRRPCGNSNPSSEPARISMLVSRAPAAAFSGRC